jgi:hypothetical protein
MAIELFGFRIGRANEDEEKLAQQVPSFAPPPNLDGAMEIAPGGAYGTFVDMEGTSKNEAQLVTRYREMAMTAEVEAAVDDIVNEAIVTDDDADPISINLDELKQPESVKKRIREEFDNILSMLDFSNMSYDLFRRWFVDGRLFYHIMIDTKQPRKGIQDLRYIDPRRIRKVRQPMKRTPVVGQNSKLVIPAYEEYYIYNPAGGNGTLVQGIKIAKDSICYVHSGLLDARNTMVLSYLHRAIKPLNQLRMLEDAVVIYRLARAPERRIFYIDVGNLPKAKAEQYVRDMMVKHKNRLVYNADTGEVKDDRKFMTMLEDYWLPRREGGRGTEITTLPGGENLGQMEDVEYFKKKLYKSLHVPVSRLEPEGTFSMGRQGEITRDEVKFAKFTERLRARFCQLFDNLLEIQLVLTGVITREEWKGFRNDIKYDFQRDNYYAEIKEQEMLNSRLGILGIVDAYAGKYYSVEWIRKNVLNQKDTEIAEIDKQIAAEEAAAPNEEDGAAVNTPTANPAQASVAQAGANNTTAPTKKPEPKVESFVPKQLSEEDKKLIDNMTKAIEKVSKEDLVDEVEFKDHEYQ